MTQRLMDALKKEKDRLAKEGFMIIGIFGSYARNEASQQSDLDVLYDVTPAFISRYQGFEAFKRLSDIKNELKKHLGVDVDLATVDHVSRAFRNCALKDVIYV